MNKTFDSDHIHHLDLDPIGTFSKQGLATWLVQQCRGFHLFWIPPRLPCKGEVGKTFGRILQIWGMGIHDQSTIFRHIFCLWWSVREDVAMLVDWGVDYLKYDNCFPRMVFKYCFKSTIVFNGFAATRPSQLNMATYQRWSLTTSHKLIVQMVHNVNWNLSKISKTIFSDSRT